MLSRKFSPKVWCRSLNIVSFLTEIERFVDSSARSSLLLWLPAGTLPETMDVDPTPTPSKQPVPEPVPEAEIYFRLLLIHHLLSKEATYPKAMELSNETVAKMQALNRRSMDPIAAKIWYAVERTYELAGDLSEARPYVRCVPTLIVFRPYFV